MASVVGAFDYAKPAGVRAGLEKFTDHDLQLLHSRLQWRRLARKKQLPPEEDIWDFFGIKSGRGFGKTLCGAKWVFEQAATHPKSIWFVVAPTHDDLIKTCFYGPAGLHGRYEDRATKTWYPVIPPSLIKHTTKSPPEITLWNDAVIQGFSAETPERLRGPQAWGGWLDEVACLVPGTKVLTACGEILIENIKTGDFVCTRKGIRRVIGAGISSPFGELWELVASNGTRLIGTGHHPVWSVTANDFVFLKELVHGDILHVWEQTSLFGGETGGIGGRTITKTAAGSYCTDSSIRRLMGGFRAGLKYTIGTITRVITKSAIWLRSRSQRICDYTLEDSYAGAESASLPPENKNGEIESRIVSFVRRAVGNINPSGNGLNSVAIGANTYPVSVVSVRRLNRCGPVYNLEVEDAHEFFANGILTHNSWREAEKAWDNLIFGMRLGPHPRIFWTGTPKPKPFIKMLTQLPRSITISGSTYENSENLSDIFYNNVAKYEGTKIGRQEIYGEIIDPEEAGFVKRSDIRLWPAKKPLPKFRFIVMSLDTAFTEETWNKKEQTGDPTACTVWGLFEYERRDHMMLLDAWEEYLGFPALLRRVKHERSFTYGDADEPLLRPAFISKAQRPSHQGRPVDLILIEDKGSGQSLRQALAAENLLTHPYNPGGMDKLSRLHAISPLFPHGRVWVIESLKRPGQPRDWAEAPISQLCTYVGEGSLAHDDLLDTETQALLFLMHRFNIRLTVPRPDPHAVTAAAAERIKRQQRSNPYDG